MSLFNRICTAGLLLLALSVTSLHARDLTGSETKALKDRIARFETAFKQNDMKEVAAVIPPKVVSAMSDSFGMEPAELLAAMEAAISSAMETVTIVSYEMDVNAATSAETTSGRPYLLVPTTTVMKVENDTLQSENMTLAFADEDVWYLVRIDDAQQVKFLTLAYPEFKGVSFPKGSIRMIEE